MKGVGFILPAVDDWWLLPSGRIVSVRRIEGHGNATEATVRYVDAEGGMAQGEFTLSVRFLLRGVKVSHG